MTAQLVRVKWLAVSGQETVETDLQRRCGPPIQALRRQATVVVRQRNLANAQDTIQRLCLGVRSLTARPPIGGERFRREGFSYESRLRKRRPPFEQSSLPSNVQASLRTYKPPFERQASLRAPEAIWVHESLPVTNEPTVGSGNVTNEPTGAGGNVTNEAGRE